MTGSGALKQSFFNKNANKTTIKSVLSKMASGIADIQLANGDLLKFGDGFEIQSRSTPGHTSGI